MSNLTQPQNWLEDIAGITTVTNDGAPVQNSPGTPTINIIGALSIVYNPVTNAIDISVSSGGSGSDLTPVNVSGPDTRTAVAGDIYFYNVFGGAVALATPSSPTLGQRFGFVFVGGPVGSANGIVVTAAGGTTIAQPVEQIAPGSATTTVQGATAVFDLPGDLGSGAVWQYDGVSKWVMVG